MALVAASVGNLGNSLGQKHKTIIACVGMVCLAAVICCYVLKPYRYVHATGHIVLDKHTGQLIVPEVLKKTAMK